MVNKQREVYEAIKKFEQSGKTCDDYMDMFIIVRRALAPADGITWTMLIEAIERAIDECRVKTPQIRIDSKNIPTPDYSGSITKEELLAAAKNIPMKVANNYTWGNHDQRPDGNCPVCDYNLSGNASSPKYERCPGCGQKLDWH